MSAAVKVWPVDLKVTAVAGHLPFAFLACLVAQRVRVGGELAIDKVVRCAVVPVLNAIYQECVGDKLITRLMGKRLRVGVLDDGHWGASDRGRRKAR